MKSPLTARVASRYMQGRAEFDPAWYGLDKLVRGEPVTLYHGTTASFKSFDIASSRKELVNKYYGSGIFLTPKKQIAEDYAFAPRNTGFPPSVIDDLRAKNPLAAEVMEFLYKHGTDDWDKLPIKVSPQEREEEGFLTVVKRKVGVNLNDLADVLQYTIGSKPLSEPAEGFEDSGEDVFNLLTGGSVGGTPDYLYDTLDKLGIDSFKYRPKVYTVSVVAKNVLVTSNKSLARSAKNKGYDAVIFHGSNLVGGVPEVAVFNPRNVHILKVELA